MLRPTNSSRIERILKVNYSNQIHTKIPRKVIERNYSTTMTFNIKERSFKTATNSLVTTRTFDLNNENETPKLAYGCFDGCYHSLVWKYRIYTFQLLNSMNREPEPLFYTSITRKAKMVKTKQNWNFNTVKVDSFPHIPLSKHGTNIGYVYKIKYHLWLCYEG